MADAPKVRVKVKGLVRCDECLGEGEFEDDDDEFPEQCNMCEGTGELSGDFTLTGLDALAVGHMHAMRAKIAAALKLDALPRNSRDWTKEHEGIVDAFESARTDERCALAVLDTALRAALLAEGGKDG